MTLTPTLKNAIEFIGYHKLEFPSNGESKNKIIILIPADYTKTDLHKMFKSVEMFKKLLK